MSIWRVKLHWIDRSRCLLMIQTYLVTATDRDDALARVSEQLPEYATEHLWLSCDRHDTDVCELVAEDFMRTDGRDDL